MTRGSELIAEFTDAPVVEVVAGVTYDGMGPESGPTLAAFWHNHLRSHFPRVEQQPAYSPPREAFNQPRGAPAFQFELSQGIPATRLWASSATGQELIQIQPGWFACNWRKTSADSTYDHWPARRAALRSRFDEFTAFLDAEGVPRPKLNQCEVTYINHIYPNALWDSHGDAAQIFNVTLPHHETATMEQLSSEVQVALTREDEQWARMYVKISPAFAQDGRTPLYVLELTVRGPVSEMDESAGMWFLDQAREAIVRTFMSITSEKMQNECWGRQT